MNKGFLCILMLFLITSPLRAGDIDLKVETNLSSPILVPVGPNIGEFTITITNFGPDGAGVDDLGGYPIAIISDDIFLEQNGYPVDFVVNSNVAQPCTGEVFSPSPPPGSPPYFNYVFRAPAIQPSESVTCHGYYYTNFQSANREIDIDWRPLSLVLSDLETNPDNDRTTMTFQGYVPKVPSLSFYGLLILMLVVFLTGYRATIKR